MRPIQIAQIKGRTKLRFTAVVGLGLVFVFLIFMVEFYKGGSAVRVLTPKDFLMNFHFFCLGKWFLPQISDIFA